MLSIDVSGRVGQFGIATTLHSDAAVTALYGRSGAGKSTLLRAVAGLWRPEQGRIVVGERVLFDSAAGIDMPVHKRCLGVVFQSPLLFPHMSVARNMRYGMSDDAGRENDRAWHETLELLDLQPLLHRYPGSLSGGEQQRVALGRALLAKPALLLLDEPMTGLDDYRRGRLLPYLQAVRDVSAVPILYVSHHREEISALADRVFVIENGKAVADMGPQEILAFSLAEPAGRT